MKSKIPAIAASILTVFALTPFSPAADASVATDFASAGRCAAFVEPGTVSAEHGREMIAQQEMPNANQNDSGDANNPGDSADSSADGDNSADSADSSGSDDQNNSAD